MDQNPLVAQLTNAARAQADDDASKATAPVPMGAEAPTTEPDRHKDPAKWLRWALLLGGGLADAVTTHQALQRPGTQEANGLMGKIVGNYPLHLGVKLGSNALIGLLTDALHKSGSPTEANVVGMGLGAGQLALAAHNTQMGKKDQ